MAQAMAKPWYMLSCTCARAQGDGSNLRHLQEAHARALVRRQAISSFLLTILLTHHKQSCCQRSTCMNFDRARCRHRVSCAGSHLDTMLGTQAQPFATYTLMLSSAMCRCNTSVEHICCVYCRCTSSHVCVWPRAPLHTLSEYA